MNAIQGVEKVEIMNEYRDYYSAIVSTDNGLDVDVLELVDCELERQLLRKEPIIGMTANDIIEEFKECEFTWKDIVKVNGKCHAEEFPISGIMSSSDAYEIDDFLEAVARKYDVDVEDVETYMMDNIDFNVENLPYGAESCGCYIDGEPEWLLD